MTEVWKSNPNYFCDYCKVWVKDQASARAIHERGSKHRENVTRRLSEMRKAADTEKRQKEEAQRVMTSIEATAKKQYELDQLAAKTQTENPALLGTWEFKSDSGYYYNAMQRWYYDPSSKMYYGGDPADWTDTPTISTAARYETMNTKKTLGTPQETQQVASTSTRPVANTAATATRTTTTTSVASGVVVRPGMRVAPAHPLANLGGYQMPTAGRIGGAKGVGMASTGTGSDPNAAAKRKRDQDGKGSKPISKEEAEALARREAARQRVQQRTMSNFGLS